MLWISSTYAGSEVGRSLAGCVPPRGLGGIPGRVSCRLRVCDGKGSGKQPLRGAGKSLATALPLLGGKAQAAPGGDKPAAG